MSDKHDLQISRDEHDDNLLAKKVTLVSSATVYAVVNTSSGGDPKTFIGLTTSVIGSAPTIYAVVNTAVAGVQNSLATLNSGPNYIGLATVDIGTIKAWANPNTYIGLTTTTIANSPVLGTGLNNIGFATVAVSTPTLYAIVNTAATGVATVDIGNLNGVSLKGNVTLDDGSLTGLVAGAAYVGLATVDIGTIKAWADPKTYIGLVTVANTVPVTFSGNVTLSDSKGYIGLTTATVGNALNLVSNVTIQDGGNSITTDWLSGATVAVSNLPNVTIGAAIPTGANYIGLTTTTVGNTLTVGAHALSVGAAYIGLATVDIGSQNGVAVKGNVTLSDSKTFIGLTTAVIGSSPSVQAYGQFYPTLASLSSGGLGPIALDQYGRVQTTLTGSITISDSKGYIGLVSISHAAWANPNTYIGLVTASLANQPALVAGAAYVGLATIDIGSQNAISVKGNITISDSKGYIGLTTATVGNALNLVSNVTIQDGGNSLTVDWLSGATVAVSALPNVTVGAALPAGAAYIGLATVDIGTIKAWADPKTYIGLVTVANTVPVTFSGNVTLSDSKGYIGLVSVSHAAWANPNTFIGLVTANISNQPALVTGAAYVGLATVDIGSLNGVAIKGNVTLSDSKTYIGLVSVSGTVGVIGNVTVSSVEYTYYNQSSLVSGYVFYGLTVPGSNPTTATYKIQRESLNTGEVLFASGAATFVHTWSSSSLASITYS